MMLVVERAFYMAGMMEKRTADKLVGAKAYSMAGAMDKKKADLLGI